MIINIIENGKILKNNPNIQINDLTLLTGENGSGKTQLLEYLRDYSGENHMYDEFGNPLIDENGSYRMTSSLVTDDNQRLQEVVYSYPGLRNSPHDINYQQGPLITQITQQWQQLEPFVAAYNLIKHKDFQSEQTEIQELNSALARFV